MIQPLRRAHYWIWLALAVLLPTLFCAGLLARRETAPRNVGFHWEGWR